MPLNETINTVFDAKKKVDSVPGENGRIFPKKLASILARNPDLTFLRQIASSLEGIEGLEDIGPKDICSPIFCSVTDTFVERSFSLLKSCQTYTEENRVILLRNQCNKLAKLTKNQQ